MSKLSRIDDNAYASIEAQSRVKHFTLRATKVDSEKKYLIAETALERLRQIKRDGKPRTVRFTFEGQKWKVVRVNERSLLQRLIRYFNPFKIKPTEGQFERYVIQKAKRPVSKKNRSERSVKTDIRLPLQRVSRGEYEKKVRGALTLEDHSLTPFTNLAAFASQRLEKKLHLDDLQTFADLDYRLIIHEGKLKLVHKTSEYATEENLKAAVDYWKQSYRATYGEKKLNEISYFYELDFTHGLTAEHIFRANIGAANVEFKDIVDFVYRVKSYMPLTGREQGLLDKYEWLEDFIDQISDPNRLGPSDLSRLASAYMFSEEEKEEAYTGRKIVIPIASNYSAVGLTKYKPWIDQQELLQIFTQLSKCKSWESYQEFLSHVVVKKHLLRFFEEGPRLGALIPAPPEKGSDEIRYYAVAGCITNGGTLSYILESPVDDQTLPIIKLYRSTTLDSYALQWSDTIMNDFNHLHSPGYLGMHYLDPYERNFIKAHTIPLWSAYLELARKKDPKDETRVQLLTKAKECYLESLKEAERPSFVDILKNHDKPLNSLFFPYASGTIGAFLKSKKNDVLGRMIEKHVHGKNKPNDEVTRSDAEQLVKYLERVKTNKNVTDILKHQIDSLIQDLNKYILNPPSREEETNGVTLGSLKEEDLYYFLSEKQQELRERPEDKRGVDLEFSGHSLGGACAAVAVARYMAVDGRVPLSGRSLKGYFYDEPAIDEEDNQAFLDYGAKHHELFQEMGVKFSIYRRHEARDVVTTAGEMGLGAVSTEEEQATLKKWLHFDGAVNHRVKTARHLEVTETVAPHATRFGEGVAKVKEVAESFKKSKKKRPGVDYVEYHFSPLQQGIFHRGSNDKLKDKVEKKSYKTLYTKLWVLSGKLERIFREQARKSFQTPFQLLRFALTRGGEQKHVLPKEQTDRNGVFVMHYDQVLTAAEQ